MSDNVLNFTKDLINSDLKEYSSIPFWSWNSQLDKEELRNQIRWMKKNGIDAFFMHARSGLKTEYLGKQWFECIDASCEEAELQGMDAWIYDENGWPSGFVGGKLLENIENRDRYLTYTVGAFDNAAKVSYLITDEELTRVAIGGDGEFLNVFEDYSVSTVDILNPEVVSQFIEHTHEQYKKHYGEDFSKKVSGFFTDEPQYYRWNTPFTKIITKYFKEKYNEDVYDRIGLLFLEKKGYRDFRYKYWKAMQELMLQNFAQRVYLWCDENNLKLTGHYVEERNLGYQLMCCGGVMPFYEYLHIPGIDKLGREIIAGIDARQVSSVAAQLKKPQVLTETFGCTGWDVSPRELKLVAEAQFVNGVNLICQHLLPYSELGNRKRDYPTHFSEINPWIKDNFSAFNDYFTKLGAILGNSTEKINIAVLNPIRSAYFDYKRHSPYFGVKEIDESLLEFVNILEENNIPYHFVDETILSKYGSIRDNKLVCGECEYGIWAFPKTYTMDKSTEKLLKTYFSNGGVTYFHHSLPEYLEGEVFDYSYLKSSITLEEILQSQDYRIFTKSKNIRSTHRVNKDGEFFYIVNLGVKADISLKANGAESLIELDILTGQTKKTSCDFTLEKYQSKMLFKSQDKFTEKLKEYSVVKPSNKFKVEKSDRNMLTLDMISISFDGIHFDEKKYVPAAFYKLLKQQYNGECYLKYSFNTRYLPSEIYMLAENMNILEAQINGNKISLANHKDFLGDMLKSDLKKHIAIGDNEIIFKINFYQSENVYYALFGENVTESLINCLVYDTEIESIYICGDFEVFEQNAFIQGKAKNVLLGNDFYISERKNIVTDLITDGYPFFAGEIVLSQNINITNPFTKLVLEGRWHAVEIFINKKYAGKLFFENIIDISDFVSLGENLLELKVCVGVRNLLGPHHYIIEEPMGVSPDTFTLGEWQDGKNPHYRESYSFVRCVFDDEIS